MTTTTGCRSEGIVWEMAAWRRNKLRTRDSWVFIRHLDRHSVQKNFGLTAAYQLPDPQTSSTHDALFIPSPSTSVKTWRVPERPSRERQQCDEIWQFCHVRVLIAVLAL